jgi:high-affinity iron transporter
VGVARVGAALAMTISVFMVIQFGENTISGLGAEAIAGIASLVAVAIVTTMVLWMKKAAAGISGQLRAEMADALQTGALAVVTLSFLAVGRGRRDRAVHGRLRRSIHILAAGRADRRVLIAVAVAYGMYKGAVRMNLAKFFKYTGIFLIVVAAGILSYGIGALQTVGWLPGLAHKAFDVTSWFNWSSWYGEAIQGIFNVTPTPTVLQFAGWLTYLVVVLVLFLRPSRGARTSGSAPVPEPTQESERSTT